MGSQSWYLVPNWTLKLAFFPFLRPNIFRIIRTIAIMIIFPGNTMW